jgi:hypothetical protein
MTMHRRELQSDRDIQPMPDFVRDALVERGLANTYEERPARQRSKYLASIIAPKSYLTKYRRLNRMLEELEKGGTYMDLPWNG